MIYLHREKLILKCAIFIASILLTSCDHPKNDIAEKESRGYLNLAANVIMSSLEANGIDQIPPRDSSGVDMIDKFLTTNKISNEPKSDYKSSNQDFGFPSAFISSGPFVKSGFIKSDIRKHSFVFVVLWKSLETQHWKKSSIILTRDRDVIPQSDEYVDDAWIAENLQEFPAANSKTYSMIVNFNRENTTSK